MLKSEDVYLRNGCMVMKKPCIRTDVTRNSGCTCARILPELDNITHLRCGYDLLMKNRWTCKS